MMRNQKGLACLIMAVALLSAGVTAYAQEAQQLPEKSPQKRGNVIIENESVIVGQQAEGIRIPAPPGDDTVLFLSTEMNLSGKLVKGAPYSAQAVTETTRVLSDGNRIKRKTSATIYRDGEGRTRREQELGAIGPWAVSGEPQQTIFINDPVSGINYILDPRTRTAKKMAALRLETIQGDAAAKIKIERDIIATQGPGAGAVRAEGLPMQEFNVAFGPRRGNTESLGKQMVEGVMAEGTRNTMTIPAGEVGNEQPIQIVFEKWYSPELQVVVMSKHSDPFVGETVYRLTNIVRIEPSRTLFEVPGDYTVKELPLRTRVFRKRQEEEK